MKKYLTLSFTIVFASLSTFFSNSVQAWNMSGCTSQISDMFGCGCGTNLDLEVDLRIAYYHPSSKKVREIYGDGWADYQLEVSKGIGCGFRLWAGVSGFSQGGKSIRTIESGYFAESGYSVGSESAGHGNHTNIELLPVSLGLKYYYPIYCNTEVFLGAAACYSILEIKDDSHYVRERTRKESWGGLVQSGITYTFCDWIVVTGFFDYYFQEFEFKSGGYGSYDGSGSSGGYHSGYVERNKLDMSGYKIGMGIGAKF